MSLQSYREEMGLEQQELAEVIGTSPSTVCRLESGTLTASLGLALEIERRTGGKVKAEHLPLSKGVAEDVRRYRADFHQAEKEGRA